MLYALYAKGKLLVGNSKRKNASQNSPDYILFSHYFRQLFLDCRNQLLQNKQVLFCSCGLRIDTGVSQCNSLDTILAMA